MTKEQFIRTLRRKLLTLPSKDRNDILEYYSEIIVEGIDSGKCEEDVIASLGNIDDMADQIIIDRNEDKAKHPTGSKVIQGAETAALVIGSPLWIAVLCALFAVALAIVCVIFSVLISLFAVCLALATAFIGGVISFSALISVNPLGAGFQLGAGVICLGLSILLFIGLRQALHYFFKAIRNVFAFPMNFVSKHKGGIQND